MLKIQKNILEEWHENLKADLKKAFDNQKIDVVSLDITLCKDTTYGQGFCVRVLTKDGYDDNMAKYDSNWGDFLFRKSVYEKGFYITEQKYEIFPLQNVLINGTEINYFIRKTNDYNHYGYATFVLDVFKKYDICAYEEHHYCNHSCIVMPKAKISDFYIDNAMIAKDWQHLRIDRIVERYNLLYDKQYANLNDLLYNFWNDWKGKPLTEICKVDVDGFNIGSTICDRTLGKFLICSKNLN